MVSKARLDLPEPESPVTTTSLSRGISTDMFLRLCTRAPRTSMLVRAGDLAASLRFALEIIGRFSHVNECQLLHQHVASFGELHGGRDLVDESLVRQILTRGGYAIYIEVPFEVGLNLSCRPRFAHFLQMFEHRTEQR